MLKVKKSVKKIKEINPPKKRENKYGLTIPIYDLSGKESESLVVSNKIFSIDVNKKLLAQYMRVYLTNQRRGTASTKTRSQVQGSTRKIYRQKGTGRARHGDIKAPIFAGGGVVGGPKPRDFSLKMNKGHITRTILGTLTLKLKEKSVIALQDQFLTMQPKTKLMWTFLKALNFVKSRILIVLPKMEKNNLLFAGRNLSNITLTDVVSLNPYEISKNSKLLIIESAFPLLEKHLLKENKKS